ncbi:MAG: hypothetical protein J4G04_02850, partial [Nitrosopumilaceae archaeon]|nr:hypothetical protein [Nitrosopumilaceae archaeon]
MEVWADYLISEATYGPGRQLLYVLRHRITSQGVAEGQVADKMTLVSEIKDKTAYVTGHKTSGGWKRGDRVRAFLLDGKPFVRIDDNRVAYDHLGFLPEVSGSPSPPSGGGSGGASAALTKLRARHMHEDMTEPVGVLDARRPPGLSAADILHEDMSRGGRGPETGAGGGVEGAARPGSGSDGTAGEGPETEGSGPEYAAEPTPSDVPEPETAEPNIEPEVEPDAEPKAAGEPAPGNVPEPETAEPGDASESEKKDAEEMEPDTAPSES